MQKKEQLATGLAGSGIELPAAARLRAHEARPAHGDLRCPVRAPPVSHDRLGQGTEGARNRVEGSPELAGLVQGRDDDGDGGVRGVAQRSVGGGFGQLDEDAAEATGMEKRDPPAAGASSGRLANGLQPGGTAAAQGRLQVWNP